MVQFMEINRHEYHCFEFGFYDTISDRVMTFNGSDTWDNVDEFIEDFHEECQRMSWKLDIKIFTNKITSKFKQ